MHTKRRLITPLIILVALVLGLQIGLPIQAQTSTGGAVVISQVYGGGGNSGATLTHDFVELFNRSASAVDISGWSVQYASSSGSTWQVTGLNGTLQPGQYYLVQEAQGSGGTTSLPTPDAIGNISMSGVSGKVALVNNSTALSGATPTNASIMDFVGYGGADFYEGSGAAPGLSNTIAALRANGGCTDTDNNAADFGTAAPDPHNTSSPVNVCDGGTEPTPTPTPTSTPVPTENPDIIITEIMYDPNSAEDDWEWIEIYNAGSETVDLAGFVVDDVNNSAHSSANIAGGTLAAGEQAILYNADDLSAADFAAAWGNVNLIPVTDWSAMALNNGGDEIALWASFTAYTGDQANHANAFDVVNYGGSGFPDPVGTSIYLTDLGADNNAGSNWATSTNGGATPLFTGYTSAAAGGNVGGEVGSPGIPIVSADLVLNEFSASTTGADVEYVEIFGTPDADFSAYTVLEIEGDSESNMGTVDEVIGLGTADSAGFYLANLSENTLENGTITLLLVSNFGGTSGSDLDTDDDGTFDATPWDAIVDAVAVTDGDTGDLSYGVPMLGPNYDGLSNFAPGGASRIPDGFDTDSATDWARNDFDLAGIPGFTGSPLVGEAYNTPGASNELITVVIPPFGACADPATLIHDIQGNGLSSPLVGQVHVIEGVVVGDFEDTSVGLSGFFLQEEDSEADGDATSSEGIFVFNDGFGPGVNVGDVVRVQGSVTEFNGLTELNSVINLAACSSGAGVTPATVTLPVNAVDDLEAFEGMLINIPQRLYVTENFTQGRFGEVSLSVDGRLFNPTNVVAPGGPAIALQDQNDRSRIQLDDGSTVQNPLPLPPYLGADNTLRGGDTIPALMGVLSFSFGDYEVHPTQAVNFTRVNERDDIPPDVGGSLKVASFNVLNYFTTIDNGSPVCGPSGNQDCRGADTADEFQRQRAKIVDALTDMNADIVGLIELENDATSVAIQDLVSGLNDILGAGTYTYIDTGAVGTDAIKVALIYKPAIVTPVGGFAILDSSVDPSFIDTKNRPVLIQTFADNSTANRFTVAINHLKSKGSDCEDVGDPDTGDGQGNCNITRNTAAQALVNYLATDPTNSQDPDFLIIGDLNSYAMEDPISTIKGAGYTDLINAYSGPNAYSYVFDGQAGYLDHALATASLLLQISGVTEWHINADEPAALDYNNFNQPALYNPDQYKASDHDPLIVGLNLLPQCQGLVADIYVDANGKIVGGPRDGRTYRGTLIGTSDTEVIVGTSDGDRILGRNGDDIICGGGGNDILYGGFGADTLSGGDDNDVIRGQVGNDTIFGDNGDDMIDGGASQDSCDGGAGQDSASRCETEVNIP